LQLSAAVANPFATNRNSLTVVRTLHECKSSLEIRALPVGKRCETSPDKLTFARLREPENIPQCA
jgi:hypothetical protein